MDMGIGLLGRPDIIIKRKFRWMLWISTPCGDIGPWFVKSASRPQIDLDETELHFRNAVTWIPGKGKWQPITVTYVDAANREMQGLYNWLATVYNFTQPVQLQQAEKRDWAGTALLALFDGCGTPLESWQLDSCFPQSIKWGELDYSDSAECTIELTLRYSEVTYTPNTLCGIQPPVSCCSGCGTPDQNKTWA